MESWNTKCSVIIFTVLTGQWFYHVAYHVMTDIKFCYILSLLQIPEAEAAIQSISIDPEGTYMAAVNNKVGQTTVLYSSL